MAKIIAVNRKYLTLAVTMVLAIVLGFAAFSLWRTAHTSASKDTVPEIRMLSLAVEPASFTKDLTYGSVTLKNAQVIPARTFDLIATIQNSTAQKMTNVPVELTVGLVGDDRQKWTQPATLQVLNPGQTVRVTFRGVKALGDAQGKSAAAGQHNMTLRIKPNPEGGVNQATEATFRFVVDSSAKPPAKQ